MSSSKVETKESLYTGMREAEVEALRAEVKRLRKIIKDRGIEDVPTV